jgi:hypothetical protein
VGVYNLVKQLELLLIFNLKKLFICYEEYHEELTNLCKACASKISHLFFDIDGEKLESKGHSF